LNLPRLKPEDSGSCYLRGRSAYPVQGWFMPPARSSMKNQRAAQPIPIPDIQRSIGIGVRLVSAPPADVGMFSTLVDRPAVPHPPPRQQRGPCCAQKLSYAPHPTWCLFAAARKPECPRGPQSGFLPGSAWPGQLAHHVVDMRDDAPLLVLQLLNRAVLALSLQHLSAPGKHPAHMPNLPGFPEHNRAIGRCRHYGHVLSAIHADPVAPHRELPAKRK